MKKWSYFIVAICLVLSACQDNGKSSASTTSETSGTSTSAEMPANPAETAVSDSITPPADFKILGSAKGDLDNDGKAEQVVVYDTPREDEFTGAERELHIFRLKDGKWELWNKFLGAVLGSQQGGMSEPFQSVGVENGCVVLTHFGGSRGKWGYTHHFRFQNNEWQLIRATTNEGTPCEFYEDFDYDLTTGKITYKKTTEDCSRGASNPIEKTFEKEFEVKPKVLPALGKFQLGVNHVKLPKSKIEFNY